MHRIFALLVASTLSFAAAAAPTTYVYTGQAYTSVTGSYSTSQRITGSFTTASRLPANLVLVDVLAQVTSYSFSDGINTYASSDPNSRVTQWFISTDASGNVSGWSLAVMVWTSGTSPHTTSDTIRVVAMAALFDTAEDQKSCGAVGTSTAGVADSCTAGGAASSTAQSAGAGAWAIAPKATAPVPTLSGVALPVLAALTLMLAGVSLRRRRSR